VTQSSYTAISHTARYAVQVVHSRVRYALGWVTEREHNFTSFVVGSSGPTCSPKMALCESSCSPYLFHGSAQGYDVIHPCGKHGLSNAYVTLTYYLSLCLLTTSRQTDRRQTGLLPFKWLHYCYSINQSNISYEVWYVVQSLDWQTHCIYCHCRIYITVTMQKICTTLGRAVL
jgi:hypothetical protein